MGKRRQVRGSWRQRLRDGTPGWLKRRLIPFECELERLASDFCARFSNGLLLDVAGGRAAYAPGSIGLDLDLRALAKRRGLSICADVHRLPVGPGRADAVCCSAALHHFQQPELALRQMHDCLRPGGLLFLTVPDGFPPTDQPDDYRRFAPHELRELLAAGWRVRQLEPIGGRFWTVSRRLMEELFRPRRGLGRLAALLAAPILGVGAPLCCYYLDRWDGRRGRPLGWMIVAQKDFAPGFTPSPWPSKAPANGCKK